MNSQTCMLRAVIGTLLILMIGICAPAAAQSGSGVSAIEGIVTDPDNQPIAGAFVMILSTETGYDRSVVTDARGRYFASSMPVGTYFVQAVSPGFART
ncbi:MAG TPA: carboxypeptidase-like regulatory domain-containing protein, partial [Burkholderiales bacterium]|nr:carboxypeptidase-like regulatory domain-containing protein [Burkholderiales bacterium]